jgi:hypothetical protein
MTFVATAQLNHHGATAGLSTGRGTVLLCLIITAEVNIVLFH